MMSVYDMSTGELLRQESSGERWKATRGNDVGHEFPGATEQEGRSELDDWQRRLELRLLPVSTTER